MAKNYDVIVLGAGPAGVTAALRAAELGARVGLVERGQPGGTAANDGVVPTRTLAYAARLMRHARQFQSYGLVSEIPQVDFAAVLAHAQGTVYRLHESKQLIERLQAAGAAVRVSVGGAQFINPNEITLAEGERLTAGRFILATGGHSRRISFPGSELCLTHSDLWRLPQLPPSVTIFGGAATGCQVASILNDFGVQVTLVERGPRLLSREDPQISETIQQVFAARGLQVVAGFESIEQVTRLDAGFRVAIQRDGALHSWETGAVISAVGWEANTAGLGLENAGVSIERGFVQVNDYLQTRAAHIYAAGDVTGRMMLAQAASYEGRTAAENAVLGNLVPFQHLIVPHGGFTDPEYGAVGLTEDQLTPDQPAVVVCVPYQDLDRAVIDGHTEGFFKLIVSVENHRLLGAAAVGEQALETIQLAAAAMSADMWVEQLAELELAYPTYTAIIGLAARRAMAELGVLPIHPDLRRRGGSLAEWERTAD